MLALTIREKNGEERQLIFEKEEVTIGRATGSDIVLPRNNISKRHARLVDKHDKVVIVDLRSTNGTYVNSRRITAPELLTYDDKVYIGDFVIRLSRPAEQHPSQRMTAPYSASPTPAEPRLARAPTAAADPMDFAQFGEPEADPYADVQQTMALGEPQPFEEEPVYEATPYEESEPVPAPVELGDDESTRAITAFAEEEPPRPAPKPLASPTAPTKPPMPAPREVPPAREPIPMPQPRAQAVLPTAPQPTTRAPRPEEPRPAPVVAPVAIEKAAPPEPQRRAVPAPEPEPELLEPADPWAEWNGLIEVVFSRLSGTEHELAAHEAETIVSDIIAQAMDDGSVPAETDRDALATDVLVELTGIGPLADLVGDPTVRMVTLNGPRSIFVDRGGEASEKNGRVFANSGTYLRGLARLAQRDAEALQDVLGLEEFPLDGAALRVIGTGTGLPVAVWRRLAGDASPLEDLIAAGHISQVHAQTVVQALIGGRNVLVCGAPSSTRAALGGAFAAQLGAERRVAVIGDGTEVALSQANVARLSANSLMSAGHIAALEAELIVFERLDAGNVAEWVSACLAGGPVLAFFGESDPERAMRRLGLAIELHTGIAQRGAAIVGEAVDLIVALQTQVDGSVVVSRVANVEGQKDGFGLVALGSARR